MKRDGLALVSRSDGETLSCAVEAIRFMSTLSHGRSHTSFHVSGLVCRSTSRFSLGGIRRFIVNVYCDSIGS